MPSTTIAGGERAASESATAILARPPEIVSPPATGMKLDASALRLLRCPVCHASLVQGDAALRCSNEPCRSVFPVVDGVPVLINEQRSLFAVDDFVGNRSTTVPAAPGWQRKVNDLLPEITLNVKGGENYAQLARLLRGRQGGATVLVLGGRTLGAGMESLVAEPSVRLVETDVAFGPRAALISDAHDIPFADASFDAVVVQAVLEYLVDPFRCVDEIHRVLKPGGLVYAETPFMQQVHGGRYDFMRFTHLGHRRLFRHFDELKSGAVCGPGSALAWSLQHFFLSFAKRKPSRVALRAFSRLAFFWLKYFDRLLIDKPGALDAASGYYFLGRKSDGVLPDRELIQLYRGLM